MFVVNIRLFGEAAFREKPFKGAVWVAEERELCTPGLEGEPLQRLGKVEIEVQFQLTARESLKPENSLTVLLPKVCHMGELVLVKRRLWGTKEMEGAKEMEGPW